MAAGLFEVGRPRRVTAEEAADIDTRWRDFGECATVCLRHPCTALRTVCVTPHLPTATVTSVASQAHQGIGGLMIELQSRTQM